MNSSEEERKRTAGSNKNLRKLKPKEANLEKLIKDKNNMGLISPSLIYMMTNIR